MKEYFRGTEVGLMIEVFQGDLKMVAENLSGFREETKKRLNELERNQKVTLEYLFKIDDQLNEIERDLKEIKAELKKMDEGKADKKELEFLKTKVLELEKELKRVVKWQKKQQKLNFA